NESDQYKELDKFVLPYLQKYSINLFDEHAKSDVITLFEKIVEKMNAIGTELTLKEWLENFVRGCCRVTWLMHFMSPVAELSSTLEVPEQKEEKEEDKTQEEEEDYFVWPALVIVKEQQATKIYNGVRSSSFRKVKVKEPEVVITQAQVQTEAETK
ncbi:hypothetical protein RFI_24485, partial [Reticulomyxa filosa]